MGTLADACAGGLPALSLFARTKKISGRTLRTKTNEIFRSDIFIMSCPELPPKPIPNLPQSTEVTIHREARSAASNSFLDVGVPSTRARSSTNRTGFPNLKCEFDSRRGHFSYAIGSASFMRRNPTTRRRSQVLRSDRFCSPEIAFLSGVCP